MRGKCSWCGKLDAELSCTNSGSGGLSRCLDFQACDRRRRGLPPNGKCVVRFRRINQKAGHPCYHDYYIRRTYIGRSLNYAGVLTYELVPDRKEATVFETHIGIQLADLYGGKAVDA